MSKKKEERQYRIRALLLENGRMKTKDLAHAMDVTPETLRADLAIMEQSGLVIREHGHARLKMGLTEPPISMRNQENKEKKRRVMVHAFQLIEDGQVVFIDSGSTTLWGLDALIGKKDLIIVTNSLLIANECTKLNFKILMIGGFVFNNGMRTYGNFATEMLDRLQIDIAFLGTDGMKDSSGITTVNENEMGLKRHLVSSSKKLVVVADSSKFEERAPFTCCRFSEIDVLVTNRLTQKQRKTVDIVPTVIEVD